MSQETSHWLNTQTLIGFTLKRGRAWHYRREQQGAESNHYEGAIPIEDVRRRLFPWKAVRGSVQSVVTLPSGETATIHDASRLAVVRPDTQRVLGVFMDGYVIHQYDDWLVKNIETILDDELSIGSAGLLREGGVAWVSVDVPENMRTPEGVEFRPHLLAATSMDGTVATTYKRCVTNVVCDNTMSAALGERRAGGGQQIKIRHSSRSLGRLQEARDALAIVHTLADDFAAQVAELTSMTVTDAAFERFLNSLVPLPDERGRRRTNAETKREKLVTLYREDPRVSPWAGNAYGVVQLVNTFAHHEGRGRDETRGERNMLRAVTGGVDRLDKDTMEHLKVAMA